MKEAYTLVYAVLPDEKAWTYKPLFVPVISISSMTLAPEFVIFDFSIAVMNLLRQLYPN